MFYLAEFSLDEFAYWLVHLNLLFWAQTLSLQCIIVWLLIGDNETGISSHSWMVSIPLWKSYLLLLVLYNDLSFSMQEGML